MVLTIIQSHILINQFNNPNINQKVHMKDPENYVLSPFEGNIYTGYTQVIKLYLISTKEIYKEPNKLDMSVSNFKDIKDHFLILANKYG